MSEPDRLPLQKQVSLSHIEQSLKIIPGPPQQAPVTIYPGPKAGNQNLSKADIELADRLNKLRKRSVEVLPTEEEVASRLANLKDLPSDHFIKSAYRVPYERPDTRTNIEKSDILLKQVMEEVSLDSKLPRPEDEIQARLSRLKGEVNTGNKETKELNTAVFTAGCAGTQDADEDEVAKLMREAGREVSEAKASLKSLKKDKELYAEVKKMSSKKRVDRRRREETDSTSTDERMSGSDDEKVSRSSKATVEGQKDKEEVDRVVNLYTRKARQKKLKAKTVPKSKSKGFEDSDSSDTETSDSNDLKTSDSERSSD